MRCTGMTAGLLALQNIRKYSHQHQRERERASRLKLEILKDLTITMQSISIVKCPVDSCLGAMFGLNYYFVLTLYTTDGENNYHWS